MRSSEPAAAARLAFAALVAALLHLAAACSGAPPPADKPAVSDQPATSASPPCDPAPSTSAPDPTVLTELRTAAEKSPLFLAVAARRTFMSCQATGQGSALTVAYRFHDGATFTVTRDSSIEYSSQDATFATPPDEDAAAILQRAERDAFGSDGCGIDWKKSISETSDDGLTTSAIFRGSACSCQARIRRDPRGAVTGLLLRSSC
jgi:hypothetical protein